jgi:hypothetical protein
LQNDSKEEQARRRIEVEKKQSQLLWKTDNGGLPPRVQTLPKEDSFRQVQVKFEITGFASFEYTWDIVTTKVELAINKHLVELLNIRQGWDSIEDYDNMYVVKKLDIPEVSKRWKTDEEFGRQRLAGSQQDNRSDFHLKGPTRA